MRYTAPLGGFDLIVVPDCVTVEPRAVYVVKRGDHMANGKHDDTKCPGEDRLLVGPALSDGSYGYVRHTAEHEIELGTMRPHKDGEYLGEDSVRLEERGGGEYAVKPIFDKGHKGPPQVVTDAYRTNWDTIFGQKQTVGRA